MTDQHARDHGVADQPAQQSRQQRVNGEEGQVTELPADRAS